MYKAFKRTFEMAARGHGSLLKRGLLLGLASPFYLLGRLAELTASLFEHGKTDKTYFIIRKGLKNGIKGGTAGRILVLAAVYFLAQYITLPLTILQISIAAYTAVVFSAIGIVSGKDEARVKSLIASNHGDESANRAQKMETEFRPSNKQWNTLQMYKLRTQAQGSEAELAPEQSTGLRLSAT